MFSISKEHHITFFVSEGSIAALYPSRKCFRGMISFCCFIIFLGNLIRENKMNRLVRGLRNA